MEKKIKKDSKAAWILKALFASYLITGILLLVLALLLYKLDLNEQKVSIGIIVVYVISTFLGGFLIGKLAKVKKFVWGLSLGIAYFALLFVISLCVYRTVGTNGANVVTTFLMCAGGGMLGGMVS